MSKYSKDINYLRQYVNGELTHTEMYEIERAMHEDEMLMDIIEGLETEKFLKSSIPTADLQAKIKSRTTTKKSVKIFTLKKLFAAASIIAVLSFGVIYFLNTTPKNDVIVNTSFENTQIEENTEVTRIVPDSSLIAYKQEEANEEVAESQNSIKREKNTNKQQTLDPKKIMVYSAKPKMQVVIEGPKYVNRNTNDVEIITTYRGEVKPTQTEILSSKVGSISTEQATSSSLAKTQADLQRLDLDPQTKANLSAVLARQAQENRMDIKEKQTENSISEVLINGNALANKNFGDSRIISSSDAIEALATKTIQNGNPSNGWTSFNSYIKEQLRKKGFKTYNANISFDLDLLMRPTNIEVKTSSNPKMNAILIELLKNGPTWENKDPNHPIFIRISSEEAKK
ncbi:MULTISPECIES: hypothetical protein [Sphingobacterium]|uniref:Anti-sigma factor n=1 Tax=Sphingobacterium litopenaei TaxID=2763500 RepID=A0ABR7YEK5_9SPHI|nr:MULTISPECIES: hypothetical protein [Sphingobacterium]MBD1429726.1 hypothetical protein [Sphingobacterium litopenaei]NGM74426.1 hypothetical protein [Sphingobacterium sp. SGL-16]